jgi:hypothetical protein
MSETLSINVYKAIILTALYGCETWSLTLRGEHRLRAFENRVLRGIFGRKSRNMAGGWTRLYKEELHNLYSQGG